MILYPQLHRRRRRRRREEKKRTKRMNNQALKLVFSWEDEGCWERTNAEGPSRQKLLINIIGDRGRIIKMNPSLPLNTLDTSAQIGTRMVDFYFEFLPAKSMESISILNFFPPNRGYLQSSSPHHTNTTPTPNTAQHPLVPLLHSTYQLPLPTSLTLRQS